MPEIDEAKQMLDDVRGMPLKAEERKEKAVLLAAAMMLAANQGMRREEERLQDQLARMMKDPAGKVFVTDVTDQCFRSGDDVRVADQLAYLIKKHGVPSFLTLDRRLQLHAFKLLGPRIPHVLVPLAKRMLREETKSVIIPGEAEPLARHLRERYGEGVRLNLNHLGEAILGEGEAQRRLHLYLDDLEKPDIEYISVKISTICSQLNLLSWDNTIEILAERLRMLYRAAQKNNFLRPDGVRVPKFVNLDMEEYRDVGLTVAVFRKVLEEPEFKEHAAGIVLQSYLPDSYGIQRELTEWAMRRVADGGVPIKIRIVKGANLAMEKMDASLHCWPLATYAVKKDVDANYKRMVEYGLNAGHAKAAHIGIASHNMFDIAYALLLRAENGVERESCFEMLEGMADAMRRVVQGLSGDMLLYCPLATKEDFVSAVAYLVRRLDENTAPENFLRASFHMIPGTASWDDQERRFRESCDNMSKVDSIIHRQQDRRQMPSPACFCAAFENEADTDWSLSQNRKWAKEIIYEWKNKREGEIPLVIGGETIFLERMCGEGIDPSCPDALFYRYAMANEKDVEKALRTATETALEWGKSAVDTRSILLLKVAQKMRERRGDLIGAMVADGGKTVPEADAEVSEAIDFVEYYRRNGEEIVGLSDIEWTPKGVVMVAPPWNFPCSIPTGGIAAALAAGNSVIFKPAPETVLVGWIVAEIFWEAGVDQKVLQFLCCEDEPVGSLLVSDPRLDVILLTGATETARQFLRMNPAVQLNAETGGKNAIIVTKMADRDLAIKDIVQSAFGHAGQKCSACSIAILEAEVYDDIHFRRQLRDAAASLTVGSAWNFSSKVTPLIRAPNPTLLRGLTELDEGEEWLLEPKQDPDNPLLWSPGIKWGVSAGSFMHQNELFGPVLAVMRAENLEHAIRLANGTRYGLTSGLETLDPREQKYWQKHIESGNLYINRGVTGAVVQRQPFGGCKASSFGRGAKAGGPNYLMQLMHARQLGGENSYSFYWEQYFSREHDPTKVIGQDNFLRYVPRKKVVLRVEEGDAIEDVKRVVAACEICGTKLEISIDKAIPGISYSIIESREQLINRMEPGDFLRTLSDSNKDLHKAAAEAGINVLCGAVLANGRVELLNYLREVSVSIDYHRYGNLGEREGEQRRALPMPDSICSNPCD